MLTPKKQGTPKKEKEQPQGASKKEKEQPAE
jgi:hypothetical protein